MQETKEDNKITVLGKTFNTEEERRNYFREELRKKLPELKQMEGFPIGEDEDILNLSDPPYYTACPNPWLNDFIAEWEDEKKQLEKDGKRSVDFEVDEPYAADVSEGKNNPIYNAHSYHTKVPHPAIMKYLNHYTQPGDIVFDGFCGTGMTGVANSFLGLNKNTSERFNFGKRYTILGDLSPIASLISNNFNSKPKNHQDKKRLDDIIKKVWDRVSWMYKTKHSENVFGVIDNTIWSDVFSCKSCGEEIIYWDAVVDYDNKKLSSEAIDCSNCGHINTKRNLERAFTSKFDKELGEVVKVAKDVPVLIEYSIGSKRFKKKPDHYDLEVLNKIMIIRTCT